MDLQNYAILAKKAVKYLTKEAKILANDYFWSH